MFKLTAKKLNTFLMTLAGLIFLFAMAISPATLAQAKSAYFGQLRAGERGDTGLPSQPGLAHSSGEAVDAASSFSNSGSYVLHLTADDSELTASDELTATVNQVASSGFHIYLPLVLRSSADNSDRTAFDESTITINQTGEINSVEVRVAASSDDAEERVDGRVSLSSSDLELVFDRSGDQTVGMRFNGVGIPPGATISKAYVQFQVDETHSGLTSLTIQGEAVDNALTFSSASGNISSRPRTTAAVTWSPKPWLTVGEAGPEQQTPDIASVIQEIVNRSGWASGNSLVIIITGTGERAAESYNGDQAGAPLLHVEFSTSVGNIPPEVTINTPENVSFFSDGSVITFTATTVDAEDGDLTANLSWESNIDGPIGTGGFFTRTDLSVGGHTITATVTDSGGLTSFDKVTINNVSSTTVLVGAGDIAGCGSQKDFETGLLLDNIAGTVFTVGDNVYPDGTDLQFNDCYDPTWGRHKTRTRPAAGNHDYHTPGASGYFNYFGLAAGEVDQGYYSYDIGDWHIIVLNSQCAEVGGCDSGSAQWQWLQAELAANPNVCTLAYWHHPRFSSGKHGNSTRSQDFWQLLYDAGADIVLNGHDHSYERFAPQDPTGRTDPGRGIREFVVGTGGAGLYAFGTPEPNSEVRENNTHGVLKLTLHPTSYDWEFIPIAGQTFTDSGSAACVLAPLANEPPTVDAGPDQAITLPNSASLHGTVTDDGLPNPPRAVTTTWRQVISSGTVTFGDANAVNTTASFSEAGAYVLRLSADDGVLTAFDELTVTVNMTNTIRVPQDQPTIQAGIDAAQDGDLVLVSPGTYLEQLVFSGKTITLASEFYTTGDKNLIDQTVIDGQGGAAVVTVDAAVGPETKIIGFTVQNGDDGISASAKLHILHNRFAGNKDAIDYEAGGGICRYNLFEDNGDDAIDLDGSTEVTIENNTIQNTGDDGIEIRLQKHISPQLTVIIRNNTIVGSHEDGIQFIGYPATSNRVFFIEHNLIKDSAMVGIGLMTGTITLEDFRGASLPDRIYVINNTFSNNDHTITGGDNLIALNNIFEGSATLSLKNVDGGSVADYNLFWNNTAGYQNSNVLLPNSVFADPLFVDPLSSEFTLQSGSPAIDAGTTFYVHNGETVLDLQPTEFNGSVPDMGAFESLVSLPTATPTVTNTATPTNTPVPPTDTPTATQTPTATATNTSTATSMPASTGLTLAAVAEARVLEANPDPNYGSDSRLDVEESHIRFNVTGVTGPVQNATWRLFVTNGSSDGPFLYATDNSWTETGTTWNNRPAATSGLIADMGAIGANTWIEYDLTPHVTGDGTYSFVSLPDSTDGVTLARKQSAAVARADIRGYTVARRNPRRIVTNA